MKKLTIVVSAVLLSAISVSSFASHWVHGYYRSTGTYVPTHESMDPGESASSGYSYHNNELTPNY